MRIIVLLFSSEEEEEEDHFEEEDDDIAVFDASDHEFSPESGIDDDEDYQPVKRARTAYSSKFVFHIIKSSMTFLSFRLLQLLISP